MTKQVEPTEHGLSVLTDPTVIYERLYVTICQDHSSSSGTLALIYGDYMSYILAVRNAPPSWYCKAIAEFVAYLSP